MRLTAGVFVCAAVICTAVFCAGMVLAQGAGVDESQNVEVGGRAGAGVGEGLGADVVLSGGLGGWSFSNGPEFAGAKGSLDEAGEGVLRLSYDFTGGGAYVAAYRDLERPEYVKALVFRVKDARPRQITVRMLDSRGQMFQKSTAGQAGWQGFVCEAGRWTGHWGGPNDGVMRQPIRQIGILVENGASNDAGEMLIEDVGIVRGEAGEAGARVGPVETEYTVTDFADGAGFGVANGQLSGGVWRIDFGAVGSSRLGHSVSLLGRPRELAITLESEAKGHVLKVRLGSHFQNFERTLGTLAGGRQVFRVNVPPEGWAFSGGQNDGKVQHPLRLSAIILERGEGDARPAEVRLVDVKCATVVEAERAVELRAAVEERATGGRRWLRVTCRGQNLLEAERRGRLRLEVADWEGRVIAEREAEWSVPGGGRTAEFGQVVAIERRLNFAEARFVFEAEGGGTAEATATFTRGMDDAGDAVLRPESPWGMGVYLYRYPGNEAGLKRMDEAAAMARAAGVKWSREEFSWGRMQPRRGAIDFAFYDQVVETATRHGISVYGLLAYWAPWTKAYTLEGIEDFCEWAKAVVGRYKGRIRHWEVYNEPNIFFWSGPRELYPVLLKRCYEAIKEADPEAEVLGISTSGIDRKFIEMCLEAGAPFDVLTIHPYRGVLSEAGFMDELAATARLVGGRPVWITEMGWSTQAGGTSERGQAELLAGCYLAAVASGACQNVSWYNFRNDGDDAYYNEHNFGVLYGDLRPKPAYRALATVCRTLAEGRPVRREFGEGVYGLEMGEGLAIWTSGQDAEVEMRKRGADVRVVNLMGERVRVEECGGRFAVEVRRGRPVFVSGGAEATGVVRALEGVERGVIRF